MPPTVLHHLHKGSFSVRPSPTEWHGVGIDECHEMKINKDDKLAVVHPSKQRMEFLSNYMSFRAACIDNLKKQIFPERNYAQIHSHIGQQKQEMSISTPLPTMGSMEELVCKRFMLCLTVLLQLRRAQRN